MIRRHAHDEPQCNVYTLRGAAADEIGEQLTVREEDSEKPSRSKTAAMTPHRGRIVVVAAVKACRNYIAQTRSDECSGKKTSTALRVISVELLDEISRGVFERAS